MATLIDNPEFSANEVYEIQQADRVEGAAAGASFGDIGISNQPHQQLANRTAYLYNQQQTDKANIAALQGQVSTLFGLVGEHGLAAFGTPGNWSWTVPADIVRARFMIIGGGGGGSSCNASGSNPAATYASGAGGGAGGWATVSAPVVPGQVCGGAVGDGGESNGAGGSTSLYIESTLIATAGGGAPGGFLQPGTSPGGGGGSAAVSSGYDGLVWMGEQGSDGQSGGFVFAGNGGGSPFGARGRAGARGGQDATGYGAGGGGAYDSGYSGVQYAGGLGSSGLVLIIY